MAEGTVFAASPTTEAVVRRVRPRLLRGVLAYLALGPPRVGTETA